MVFGWFSKDKSPEAKLAKAAKLRRGGRWAEALAYFDEILEAVPASPEAREGARSCRERLVAGNLAEARALSSADPEKAREHAELALELAAGEEDLRRSAQGVLDGLRATPEPRARSAPVEPAAPLFAPSCGCAAPCGAELADEVEGGEADVEDLFSFYVEGMAPEERAVLEAQGPAFREGFVLLQQGRCADARPLLEDAARRLAESPAPAYALGLLAGFEGDVAEAQRQYRRALAADPAFGPAHRHLAQLYRETNRAAEALEVLDERLGQDPDDAEARLLAAACALDAGDFERALREASEARRVAPSDELAPSFLLAQAHRATGNRDQALQVLQGVLSRKPDQVQALAAAGDLLLEEGVTRAERAAELFKRCYRNDPEHGWMYLLKVAEAYSTLGRRAEAEEALERAGGELPGTADARRAWEAVERIVSAG